MTWSSDKPVKPGWYWYRRSPEDEDWCVPDEVVELVLEKDTLAYALRSDRISFEPIDRLHGQWAGPLPIPKDS